MSDDAAKPSGRDPRDHDRALAETLEQAPYCRALGLRVAEIDAEGAHARIELPFAPHNANPGDALHGGCAASLTVLASHAVARAAIGRDSGPWVLGQVQVHYLAAAIGVDVAAEARLQRRGRALAFVETAIRDVGGRAIASATSVVRAEQGAPPTSLPRPAPDPGGDDPGPLAAVLEQAPFMAARGLRIEHMAAGRSRIAMPCSEANRDAEGRIHEGAMLALLDTTGAMAAFAEFGPGAWKASTPSIQAQTLAPAPAGEVVAYGRCVQRDREMSWNDVEIVDPARGRVVTRGTVFYRLAS